MRQAPESFFRSKTSIPLGSARLSCLSLNNLPPSPALCHGSRFTSCSMDDASHCHPQNPFFALKHDRNVLLVSQSSLSSNNLPPARDTRDGTRVLPGLLPRTRFSLQKPLFGDGTSDCLSPRRGIPHPHASRPRSPRRAMGIRSGCDPRVTRIAGGRANGRRRECICYPPRMRTRPPAPTRKRTTHKKFTIAYI